MGEMTLIEWCDYTFNAWIGCEKVSPACKNCYASVDTFARMMMYRGIALWGSAEQGALRYVTSEDYWKKPLKWQRDAEKNGEKKIVFCNSLSDIFDDWRPTPDQRRSLPIAFKRIEGDEDPLRTTRARLWKLMQKTPNLYYLLLTKRPENAEKLARIAAIDAREVGSPSDVRWWLPNVWLGSTAENKVELHRRASILNGMSPRPAKTFLSMEPLLEECDVRPYLAHNTIAVANALQHHQDTGHDCGGTGEMAECSDCTAAWQDGVGIDWVIVGGESGSHIRSIDVGWIKTIVTDCKSAKVPVFVKQLGRSAKGLLSHNPTIVMRMKHKKGGDPVEWPPELRVREFPVERA